MSAGARSSGLVAFGLLASLLGASLLAQGCGTGPKPNAATPPAPSASAPVPSAGAAGAAGAGGAAPSGPSSLNAAPAMPGKNVPAIKVNTVGYPASWRKLAIFNVEPRGAVVKDAAGKV